MPTMTWQDGFEGAEDLIAIYGSSNVYGGAHLAVGGGRSGGNGLVCSGSGVIHATGISSGTDPVQVGIARSASGFTANVALGDTHGDLIWLGIDSLDRVVIQIVGVTGVPTFYVPVDSMRFKSVWRYLELYYVADLSGRVAVAADGDTVFDVSGIKTANVGRGPDRCVLGGSGAILDDWYLALGDASPAFYGDWAVTGNAPTAAGSVPSPGDVRVDQQFIIHASSAPKSDVRVDQQFIILAIKNKPGAPVRPQVFGVGRV